eukprot:COSAG06_NODE_3837_length_4851_cov_14.083333_8_plen_108_part_01
MRLLTLALASLASASAAGYEDGWYIVDKAVSASDEARAFPPLFTTAASQDIARTRAPPRSADANRLTKRTPRLLCYPQVTVTIVVQEQGADEIRRIATAVSDPRSPEY